MRCKHGTPHRNDGIPLCGSCRTPDQEERFWASIGMESIDANLLESTEEVAEWFTSGRAPRRRASQNSGK